MTNREKYQEQIDEALRQALIDECLFAVIDNGAGYDMVYEGDCEKCIFNDKGKECFLAKKEWLDTDDSLKIDDLVLAGDTPQTMIVRHYAGGNCVWPYGSTSYTAKSIWGATQGVPMDYIIPYIKWSEIEPSRMILVSNDLENWFLREFDRYDEEARYIVCKNDDRTWRFGKL